MEQTQRQSQVTSIFDILEEEYGGDDLKEFEVLEELSPKAKAILSTVIHRHSLYIIGIENLIKDIYARFCS